MYFTKTDSILNVSDVHFAADIRRDTFTFQSAIYSLCALTLT